MPAYVSTIILGTADWRSVCRAGRQHNRECQVSNVKAFPLVRVGQQTKMLLAYVSLVSSGKSIFV